MPSGQPHICLHARKLHTRTTETILDSNTTLIDSGRLGASTQERVALWSFPGVEQHHWIVVLICPKEKPPACIVTFLVEDKDNINARQGGIFGFNPLYDVRSSRVIGNPYEYGSIACALSPHCYS